VRRLYAALTGAGLRVWWDRKNLPSRQLAFTEEIRRAIDDSQRLLLVCGPGALASDYVGDEINHALKYCKGILPLLRRGEYSHIPPATSPTIGRCTANTQRALHER
jgi:hypothetical protein